MEECLLEVDGALDFAVEPELFTDLPSSEACEPGMVAKAPQVEDQKLKRVWVAAVAPLGQWFRNKGLVLQSCRQWYRQRQRSKIQTTGTGTGTGTNGSPKASGVAGTMGQVVFGWAESSLALRSANLASSSAN